jgi:hypothetical protein
LMRNFYSLPIVERRCATMGRLHRKDNTSLVRHAIGRRSATLRGDRRAVARRPGRRRPHDYVPL